MADADAPLDLQAIDDYLAGTDPQELGLGTITGLFGSLFRFSADDINTAKLFEVVLTALKTNVSAIVTDPLKASIVSYLLTALAGLAGRGGGTTTTPTPTPDWPPPGF